MPADSGASGRTRIAVAVTAGLVALLTVVSPGIASAHSDTGTMTVTKFEQIAPDRVTLQVGLIFEGDEHLAQDATVSATLKSADGGSVGPVSLTKASGDTSLYSAEIDVTGPGQWTAEVTSTNPAATASATVDVAAAQTTTTSTVAETTTSAAPESTTAPAGQGDDSGGTTGTGAEKSDDADDSDNTALYVGLAALVVIIVAGVALLLNRKSAGDSSDGDQSGNGRNDPAGGDQSGGTPSDS